MQADRKAKIRQNNNNNQKTVKQKRRWKDTHKKKNRGGRDRVRQMKEIAFNIGRRHNERICFLTNTRIFYTNCLV